MVTLSVFKQNRKNLEDIIRACSTKKNKNWENFEMISKKYSISR